MCVCVYAYLASVRSSCTHYLWFKESIISLSFFCFLIDIPIYFFFCRFFLWCIITIGGWQQITRIIVATRAIRRHHRRWFFRLIIIALSRSGPPLLRSSTLLLSSSRRFHRSQYYSYSNPTTSILSDIHDSYLPLLYIFLQNTHTHVHTRQYIQERTLIINLLYSKINVNISVLFYWCLSVGQILFFLSFVNLIQRQVWTCKHTYLNNNHYPNIIDRLWVVVKRKSNPKLSHLMMHESSEKHGKW